MMWTAEKVVKAFEKDPKEGPPAFAAYAQQQTGIPYPTAKDMAILRKKVKELFDSNPNVTPYTLCRLVDWARTRKKRFSRIWALVDAYRDAWAQGVLPELDPRPVVNEELELKIQRALEQEDREPWRKRLLLAVGEEARRQALDEWEAQR